VSERAPRRWTSIELLLEDATEETDDWARYESIPAREPAESEPVAWRDGLPIYANAPPARQGG
jgi:hypothetical protein